MVNLVGWMVMQLSLTCTDDEKTHKYENFLHYIKKLNHIKTKMEKLLVDKKKCLIILQNIMIYK